MIESNITAEEKLMYQVMGALYDSGVPVTFKGALVLRAFLLEAGYPEETRHTTDIDGNWNSETAPSGEEMTEAIQNAFEKKGISFTARLYRMYGEKRSAGFDLADKTTGETIFTMDLDVNRAVLHTKLYETGSFSFCGSSPAQMVADKLMSVSTDRVFRRIKDVADLYYLSQVFDFNRDQVLQLLEDSGRTLDTFYGFLYRTEELRHAYEKFRFSGSARKPSFDEVHRRVREYIGEVLGE